MRSFYRGVQRRAWVIGAISVLLSSTSYAGFRVVSDVDDTIKITSVRDPVSAVWNTLFHLKTFAGMPELYQALMAAPEFKSIDYVSAAPKIVEPQFSRFFKKHGFPSGRIHLRGMNEAKEAYKLRVIKDLLAEFPDDEFILIGDDQELDPTVYFTLFLENPGRIREIYIRSVRRVRMPSAVYTFVTAFDIARMEFEFQRMDEREVEKIGLTVLEEKRDSRVMPNFQTCPQAAILRTTHERVIELQKRIDSRINEICDRRGLIPFTESM